MADELLDGKGTVIPGSDPGTGGNPSDSPPGDKGAKGAGSPPAEELGEDGKPLPFDKHPKWIAARQAEKALQKLLSSNDVESVEDLVELVQSGRKVIGKVDLDSLDEIITKANTLTKYEEYWEAQREAEKTAKEEPNETAERLRRENTALKAERAQQSVYEENQKALKDFDIQVLSGVKDALPDLPDGQKRFLAEFLGVGNPAVEVEITNKQAVSKVVRDGVKKFEKFKQQIIKDYLDGKEKIIAVPRADTGGISKAGEVKTLKDARKTFLSMFGQ